jgi:hypothetical protein
MGSRPFPPTGRDRRDVRHPPLFQQQCSATGRVDATVVRGHQHAAGARGEPGQPCEAKWLMAGYPRSPSSLPSAAPDPAGVT